MKTFIRSASHAWRGVGEVIRSERNARIHLLIAVIVLLLGIWLQLSASDMAAVVFAILLVFLAEIFNTAVEKILDLVEPKHNPTVGRIKDMAAGGVLVAAIGAVVIGALIFWPYVIGQLWTAR